MVYKQPTQQEIDRNWQALSSLIAEAGIDMGKVHASSNNKELDKLQAVMRHFFISLEKDKPGEKPNSIIYGGNESHVLDFTRGLRIRGEFYPDKNSFLDKQSRNGEEAEDVILFAGLSKLGINTIYDVRSNYAIASGRYQPYSVPNAKATFTLINYFNGHWELSGRTNAGRGNCGFYAVSQMVAQLWSSMKNSLGIQKAPIVEKAIAPAPQTTIKIKTTEPLITQKTSVTATTAKSLSQTEVTSKTTETLYLTQKNENHFIQTDKLDKARFDKAKSLLFSYDLLTLVKMYHYARDRADGDTYLANRPYHVTKEYGKDILSSVLKTGKTSDPTIALLAQDELVHMLATECKRNPIAFEQLQQFANKAQSSTEQLQQSAQPKISCASQAQNSLPPLPKFTPQCVSGS